MTDRPTSDRAPQVLAVHPAPEPAVLAAIMAAVAEAWPKPPPPAAADGPPSSAWRFSGRWWSKPTPVAGDRPRRG